MNDEYIDDFDADIDSDDSFDAGRAGDGWGGPNRRRRAADEWDGPVVFPDEVSNEDEADEDEEDDDDDDGEDGEDEEDDDDGEGG